MFLKAFILCRWPIYSSPLPDSSDPDVVFSGDRRPLLLIDFGQSIDMTRYPPGTTFLAKVKTSSFMCIEMQTDRPWTYQVNIESHSHTSVLRNRNTHTYTYQVKCILKQIKLVELILWMPFFSDWFVWLGWHPSCAAVWSVHESVSGTGGVEDNPVSQQVNTQLHWSR